MDGTKKVEFTIDAGSRYELPFDSSLNQIEKELKARFGSQAPSRKLIRQALNSLAENCKDEVYDTEARDVNHNKETSYLFKRIIEDRSRYDAEIQDPKRREMNAGSTRPAAIYWEEISLIKALALARAKNHNVKGNDLARLTLNQLIDDLLESPISEIDQTYLGLQFLKEGTAQNLLIQRYEKLILQRLGQIEFLTLYQPAEVAVQNMQEVFPALDSLIIDLTQQIAPIPQENPPSYVKQVEALYDSLRSIRDSAVIPPSKTGTSFAQIRFSLPENPDLLSQLEKGFEKKWSELSTDQKAQLKQDYEKYLICSLNRQEPGTSEKVHDFLLKYGDLKSYIQKTKALDEIRTEVRKELCTYAAGMFQDVKNRDIPVTYSYSTYPQTSSGSSFISYRTRNAHDQMRAKVHNPLRRLLEVTYIENLCIKNTVELSASLFESPRFLQDNTIRQSTMNVILPLYERLDNWLKQAYNAFLEMKVEFPHLPLITSAHDPRLTEFITAYDKCVPDMFSNDFFAEGELRTAIQVVLNDTSSLLEKVFKTATLLKAAAQLVTTDVINETVEEICKEYQHLSYIFTAPQEMK